MVRLPAMPGGVLRQPPEPGDGQTFWFAADEGERETHAGGCVEIADRRYGIELETGLGRGEEACDIEDDIGA